MDIEKFFNYENSNNKLRGHFIKEKVLISELLKSTIGLKEQSTLFARQLNIKCCKSSYIKYVKEFYNDLYAEHLNLMVIENTKPTIYILYLNGERNLKRMYLILKNKAMLKKSNRKLDNIISYDDFKRLLKKDFERAEFKDIVYPDNIEEINNKTKIVKEDVSVKRTMTTLKENFKNDSSSLASNKHIDKKQKIGIELLDGKIDNCPLVYLKNEVIMKNTSNSAYDFNEKNYIVVPSIYKNNLIDFEFIKKSILQKEDVKNYSLIFHDNGKKDGNIYIYRLIDKELHVLKKFSSGHCMDFEIYYNNGIKNFLSFW